MNKCMVSFLDRVNRKVDLIFFSDLRYTCMRMPKTVKAQSRSGPNSGIRYGV